MQTFSGPKFELVEETLERELGGLGIGEWTCPKGGYFISFEAMDGCAKEIVAKCKKAGVTMTGAGSFPLWKGSKGQQYPDCPNISSVK